MTASHRILVRGRATDFTAITHALGAAGTERGLAAALLAAAQADARLDDHPPVPRRCAPDDPAAWEQTVGDWRRRHSLTWPAAVALAAHHAVQGV